MDDDLPYVIGKVGEDFLVTATDFPHGDAFRQDQLANGLKARGDLSDTTIEKILVENPQRLFHFHQLASAASIGLGAKRETKNFCAAENFQQGPVDQTAPGFVVEDVERPFPRNGAFVRPVSGRERIEDIGDGHHLRLYGNPAARPNRVDIPSRQVSRDAPRRSREHF